MNENVINFVKNRPEVVAAYGYGSGIFKQSGYTSKDKPQIDLILVVDDLKKWHKENMKANPKDFHSNRGLMKKIGRRRDLMTYLKNKDLNRYKELVSRLGLRK